MCGMNGGPRGSTTPQRPSWTGLYALAGLMLGALFLVQALVAPGPERTALQCGLVLGGFATMVHWTRRNRVALDHLDWCDCASSRTIVRVIPSRQAQPHTRWADARTPVALEPVEATLEEVAR
jgi:hypothetical protein